MKAYEVKPGTKVKVVDKYVITPPASIPVNKGDVITILKLDGIMYCNAINENGDRIYIGGGTEVELYNKPRI